MTIFDKLKQTYKQHATYYNILLVLIWLVFNLIQSASTELANDEAYYWVYSRNLDFGFFDHPPAIAALIKIGYGIFHTELGVRLGTVLLFTATIPLIYQLTNRRSFLLFFMLFCSISVFEVYGFIAVPDVPLLFFTAAFFVLYKRYLDKPTFLTILLLSLSIDGMLYSKYHGLLVLFFTLLSNLSLLKHRHFYLVIALSVCCYLPHIVWQIVNDYPSYQYHVLTKSQDPYKPIDSLLFLLGQLVIAGPLVSGVLFYSAFRYPVQQGMEKALKFTLAGFMVFFLFSTINAPVEANWTVASFIPLLVLGYNHITTHTQLKKWTVVLSGASCLFFLVFRLNLLINSAPMAGSSLLPEVHGWKSWAQSIESQARNTPVVFANSYQKAAKYHFYTGKMALSLNNIHYRRNQYDLWAMENRLQGKTVLYVPNWNVSGEHVKSFSTSKGVVQTMLITNFRSYAKVTVSTPEIRYKAAPGQSIRMPLTLRHTYAAPLIFGLNDNYPDSLVYCLFREEAFCYQKGIMPLNGHTLDHSMIVNWLFRAPKEEGYYYLRLSISNGWLPPMINSRLIPITVDKDY